MRGRCRDRRKATWRARVAISCYPLNMHLRKTVIFDFDGTLVDSFLPGLKLVNSIASEFGFKTVAANEVARCRNMSPADLMRFLQVPIHKLPLIIKRLRKDIAKDLPNINIVKGVSDCLRELQNAGASLGIVTSNAKENVRICLEQNEVFSFFDFLYSSTNIFGKHRTLGRVLKKRNLKTEDAVYVGDESRDIQAARKCNIRVIAVDWGLQSRAQLISLKPDFLASAPMDIVRYVHSLT